MCRSVARTITINFDGSRYQVPVSRHGVWAFIKTSTDPGNCEFPTPTADKNTGTALAPVLQKFLDEVFPAGSG